MGENSCTERDRSRAVCFCEAEGKIQASSKFTDTLFVNALKSGWNGHDSMVQVCIVPLAARRDWSRTVYSFD